MVALATHDKGTRSHTARNDSHIAFACPHRSFASNQNVLAEMRFACYIVVVTVNRLQFRVEGRQLAGIAHRADDLFYHQVTVPPGIILCPLDRLDIVIEVLRVLRKIGQVNIRQIHKELLHVLASDVDEVTTHAIADSARSAMKHEPDSLRFIQTDFDEMVTRSECAEMVRMIAAIQLRMLREYSVVTR